MSDEPQSPDRSPLATIPAFRPPSRRRLDPGLPEDENRPNPLTSIRGGAGSDDVPPFPPALDGHTRTGISGTPADEKPSVKDTAKLVAGLVGMVAVGAAMVVRWRFRAKLREPSKAQAEEMAEPLARIGLRHIPASKLNPDLLDATQFAAALGRYLNDGPLLERAYDNPGEIPQGDE